MRSLLIGGALLAALAGCGVEDDRPETLVYITETILAPACATATCHSSFTFESNLDFSTPEAAQISLQGGLVVPFNTNPYAQDGSHLLGYLVSPGGSDAEFIRMPYDAPLSNVDIALIESWIAHGAEGFEP